MEAEPVFERGAVSGNGKLLELTRANECWEARFISEPRTSPQALWFHVQLTGLQGAPVRFIWDSADLTLGDPRALHLVRPVLRADGGPWRRAGAVRAPDTPDGRRHVVFTHEGGADRVAAAFCYPYTPEDLSATLDALPGVWETTTIGLTGDGRELPRLRLAGKRRGRSPAGLYLLARQHAGETPGSWLLDGILRFAAGDEEPAQAFREGVDCWAAPFADLDGVVLGNYGKDALPWDFNRAWERLPMRPEVDALQHDLGRFASRNDRRLVIDLHGPGHATPDLYLQLPRAERPGEQQKRARQFADHLSAWFPELGEQSLSRPTGYPSRWNPLATLGSWCWDYLTETLSVTVEASYQQLAGRVLECDDYREIGRRIALAALDWLVDS